MGALASGLVLLWLSDADRKPGGPGVIVAASVTGFGAFNVFDGVVSHKVLRLHQIRPGDENLLVYDIVWISLSAIVAGLGLALLQAMRRRARPLVNADRPAVRRGA